MTTALIALLVALNIVGAIIIVAYCPPVRRLFTNLVLMRRIERECEWCQPPGSGKITAHSRLYGDTVVPCGECRGSGSKIVRVRRFRADRRDRG